jgi:hypothetical protein
MAVAIVDSSLVLKRASAFRPLGEWNEDDFDVLADGAVVGRIFKANASPVGASWIAGDRNSNTRASAAVPIESIKSCEPCDPYKLGTSAAQAPPLQAGVAAGHRDLSPSPASVTAPAGSYRVGGHAERDAAGHERAPKKAGRSSRQKKPHAAAAVTSTSRSVRSPPSAK